VIFGSVKKESELPAILIYDTICERYGWTFDEVDRQLELNPSRFGELLALLDAKGRQQQQQSNNNTRAESDARRRRLGVI
jgi:hypothetical protein